MGLFPLGIASHCMGGIKSGQARTRFRKAHNLSSDPCCTCSYFAKCCFAGDKEKQPNGNAHKAAQLEANMVASPVDSQKANEVWPLFPRKLNVPAFF
jgi:hypothetical protein